MSQINTQRYYSSEIFGMFARAFSYIGGGLVIVLAYSVYATGMSVEFISEWALNVLGLSFIVLLAALLLGAVLALLKVQKLRSFDETEAQKWRQFGLQASSGIATLALTYTLLGICLGIGGLSDANLSPDTINQVIADLTAQFSTAFMSSVIGLPISAAMRTILIISMAALPAAPIVVTKINLDWRKDMKFLVFNIVVLLSLGYLVTGQKNQSVGNWLDALPEKILNSYETKDLTNFLPEKMLSLLDTRKKVSTSP